MKKILITIVAVVLVVGIGVGAYAFIMRRSIRPLTQRVDQPGESESATTTKRYGSSAYGFSANYPASWQYQEIVKTSQSGRSGLVALVVFSPTGSVSDTSVTVSISEPRSETPVNARATTVNGRSALYYEDANGERTYVLSTDWYQYSLLMGSAGTAEVRAAYDVLVKSFSVE